MKIRLTILAAAASFLLIQGPVLAHHGSAAYDNKTPVTVTGIVTDFQFVNPHVIVSFDVKDEKGGVQKWQGELTSPNHLLHAGWNAHSIKPGDQITLTGLRAANGSTALRINKTVVNGKELSTAEGD